MILNRPKGKQRTSKEFVITDYYEILNLQKALMEAKFCDKPNDHYVSSSPIIASLHNRIVDHLASLERPSGGDWETWRRIDPSRREWSFAIGRIAYKSKWLEVSRSEKAKIASNLIAPFKVSAGLLQQFLIEADTQAKSV